jgi:hypothetical protein
LDFNMMQSVLQRDLQDMSRYVWLNKLNSKEIELGFSVAFIIDLPGVDDQGGGMTWAWRTSWGLAETD